MVIKKMKNLTVLSEIKRGVVLARISSGEPVSAICKDLGLDRGHVYKWLRDPVSRSRLDAALAATYAELETRLPNLITASLDILEIQLRKGGPETSLKAAQIIVALLTRLSSQQPYNSNNEGGTTYDP